MEKALGRVITYAVFADNILTNVLSFRKTSWRNQVRCGRGNVFALSGAFHLNDSGVIDTRRGTMHVIIWEEFGDFNGLRLKRLGTYSGHQKRRVCWDIAHKMSRC